MTCTASDDNGDLFPVTQDGYFGYWYHDHLAEVEDAAIDRCYNETNGDASCYLVGCDVGY